METQLQQMLKTEIFILMNCYLWLVWLVHIQILQGRPAGWRQREGWMLNPSLEAEFPFPLEEFSLLLLRLVHILKDDVYSQCVWTKMLITSNEMPSPQHFDWRLTKSPDMLVYLS